MFKKLLLFSCLALSFATSQAAYIPVALNGFNFDGVANGVGTAASSTSGSFDAQGYYLVDSSFVHPTYGTTTAPAMPTNLLINSVQDPNLQWQLKPYTGNNVLRITNIASDSLILQSPQPAGEVYILYTNIVTGSNGTVNVTLNFTDGTSQAATVFTSVPNWFYSASAPGVLAKVIGGRLNDNTGGGYQTNNSTTGGPLLYQFKVTVLPANYAKSIRNVKFDNTVTGNILNVFAITLNSLCSGSVTAGNVASTAGATACPAVNYTLSLPTATSGVGITYQWQSAASATGPWTSISGATNLTYTASQTATTYYRAYIACNGGTADTSAVFTEGIRPANQCYCNPANTSATQTYYITSFSTTGGTTNITNTGTGAGITSIGYSDYSGTLGVTAMQSTSVNFSSAFNSTFGARIWVDWNQDGVFDNVTELVYSTSSYVASIGGSFTVPPSALPGNTRMRIRIHYLNTGAGIDPCTNITTYSEAEDYGFTVVALPTCSGAPTGGTGTSSVTNACAGVSFNLTAPGATVATGITYQWQSSATGLAPWTAITGATTTTYSTTQTAATSYRLKVTCNGTDSSFSSIVTVGQNGPSQCYCIPTNTYTGYYINNFSTTGGLSNITNLNSGDAITSPGYSDYTSKSVAVIVGNTFSFTGSYGSSTTSTFGTSIYVDWDQDGTFTGTIENPFNTTGYATTFSGSITVPASALPGNTRIRVRNNYLGGTGAAACGLVAYSEAEDYILTVIPNVPCAAPTTQATALLLTPAVTSVSGSFTASIPAANKYLILRTPGTTTPTVAPVNTTSYTVGTTLGNATVISAGTNATTFTDAAAAPSTQYRYTIYGYNDLCVGGPIYNTTTPLSGTTTTNGVTVYTWNGLISTDWQIAGNWTPNRTTPDASDVLQFNNGLTNTVTNIPNQTIGRLTFTNNTTANYRAQTGSAKTLTFASDNNAATNELDIAAGSNINLNDTIAGLNLKFTGTGGTSRIAGTLEINNRNSIANTVDFTNTTDTVTTTGTLAAGGTVNTSVFTSTAANLVVNGNYIHKYTTVGGGAVPTATWGPASGVQITSYTTATGGPNGGLGQTFNDFTYNAPLQTANTQWSGTLPNTVNGTLSVISTGTGQWLWATTTAYTVSANNYVQTGGVVDLGTSTGAKTLNVAGVFTQSAGILKATGNGVVTLNYNGTAAAQNVSFLDSSVTGAIVYRVTNPFGINLTGTGALATSQVFKINTGGGVQITSSAANPINTTMALTYFATGTTLTYDGTASQAITNAIWPVANGPLNVTINNTGVTLNNQVMLPGARTMGAAAVLTISNGVLALGSNNLTITNNATGAISISTPSATRMIAADGSGQLIRAIGTTASTTYLFPVGDQTGTAEYSPVSLTYVTNAGARNVGVRVVNAHNPNDASTNYLNRYWVITDTATAAYTYTGNFTYTPADIIGTEANLRLSEWNGTVWAQIPSLPAVNVLTIQGTQSSAFRPLGGMQITGRTSETSNTYVWNGTTSTDYQIPANWTPARNVPDPNDFLLFNNNIVDTVKNIPTQTITRLTFSGTTTGVFQTNATNTLTFVSDNNPATNEFDIAPGASLISNGNSFALTLAFSGTGATANIAGLLESVSNSVNNVFNFTNAVATVTSVGTLAEGGSNSVSAVTGTTAANLLVNGLFNYKYTTNTVGIPTAAWNTGSTFLISGYTTVTGGPNGGQNQTFYNLTYNCPNQTAAANWSGTGALTVTNNFTVASTGTGSWQYAGTQGFNALIGNYVQTGGTFNLSSGVASAAQVFNVAGTFNQTGGTFTASGASTGANAPTLNFNGTTAQNVTFYNAAPIGPITYRVSNPAGINLTGSGTLTSAFAINSNGGVRISSTAANPINTTLALTYATTASTLTYDPAASATATAAIWPTTSGPLNVTINTGSSAAVVAVPFNRTIGGTLTMTSGDLDLTSNTLTLGTAAATPGTLSYTTGNIRVTTGTFNRWYGTTGLPTATGTGIGFYPLASSTGANRNVALYFSAATALSTGGSIAVGHSDISGLATITPVTDAGPYSIDRRTNAFWSFAQTGIVLSGTNTIGVRLTGQGLISSPNPANLRVMQPAAVVGTHVPGSGVSAQRTGLVVADLTSPYHIGANSADISGAYIATTTGTWSATSTWLNGLVPGVANDAFINPNVVVTADAATNTAKSLTILPGGTLTAASATAIVTIDSAVLNSGTVNVTGGSVIVNGNSGLSGITNNAGAVFNVASGTARLGAAGGSNKPFTNNGTLTVSGGTINVNGNLLLNASSTFSQSGGNINVDGNAGGVVANSVLTGTPIVNILTPNVTLTAGNFTVVDPHVGATTNTFVYNNAANINAGGTHTFVAGNATSTDTGYNASYGLSVNTNVGAGKLAFMNVIANSGTAANSWVIFGATNTGILGNFTINAGAEHRQGGTGNILYLAGNLINNGTYSALGTTYFGNYTNGTAASNLAAQTVSGTGTFRNLLTAPTGKFYKIQANNNYNVTFNIGDVPFSSSVVFTASTAPAPVGPSRIIMQSNSILSELGGASVTASATAGWVVGRYQKAAAVAGFNGTFPVGDLNYYTPVNIGTATVTTAGAIWASTTSTDHPNLATSSLVGAKSVNRYFTLTPVNGIVFSGGATATFNWNAADVDAGANTAIFALGKYTAAAWTYPAVATPGATSLITGALALDLNAQSDYAIAEPCSPINITTPPAANVAACLGSSATFSVGLSGTSYNVSYQWQKGTTNIPGATGATYTIPATSAADAGTYRVIITSLCAAVAPVTSTVSTLTINTPASITVQPATQAICQSSPVTFNVTATGTGLTYQWQKNGVDISGAVSPSYTIPVAGYADTANYTVKVSGTAPCGFVTSTPAALTIKQLPLTITAAGPTNFCPGGSVVLNAPVITPTNTLTYQWRLNGTPNGSVGSSYTATASGSYTATITNTANGCSNISNAIVVNVNGAPQATINPAGAAAFCQGGNIILHGLNTPGLTYQWFLNGNPATGLSTDSVYTTNVAGSYTLQVSIGSGCFTTSTPTVVTVNPLPTITTTPTGNQAICQGDSLTITGLYNNANPQWRFNGNVIAGATNSFYKATATGNYSVTVTNPATGCTNTSALVTLTVNPLPVVTVTSANASTFCAGGTDTLKASPTTGLTYVWSRGGVAIAPAATGANYVATTSGVYTVTGTNTNGCKATSTGITVTVNPLPVVVVTPSLGLTICQGQTTTLCVPAVAGITYQWKDAVGNITGATTACYAATASGTYSVVATITATGCNATSVSSTVTVNPVPVATVAAPASTTACTGDTVCLNANTGTNLTYQWRLNGNAIIGATLSTYCVSTGGAYTVVVTNGSNCSSTSTAITMIFNPRPTANITYTTPITFCEGGAVVLTSVSNTGITYQWQNNGASITGASNSNYIASGTGNYSVIITNSFGCSTVSPTIVVVSNPLPQPQITRTGNILTTGSYAFYQWYLNSQAVTGATGQSINATQNGGYAVRVIDANGCTNYSGITFVNNVGIGGNPAIPPASVRVFPNPVRNVINIDAPAQVNVVLRDLTGRIITQANNVKQLDMTGLPDGYYMLMIADKNGVMIKAEKVMKVAE